MSLEGQSFSSKFSDLDEKGQKISIEKELMLEKALRSDDVDQIFKARKYISQSKSNTIESRDESPLKTILVDPNDLNSSLGFKNKAFSVSYDVLRAMSRTHIIKSIHETRKDQVSVFCQPQANKYSTGFIITKKTNYFLQKTSIKLTKSEEQKIEKITELLLSCGSNSNFWHADTFDTFIKKIVGDSLMFDQATFEVGRNRGDQIVEFLATDASTIRIADSYNDDDVYNANKNPVKIKGYSPSYVQVIDSIVENEYYPWEMCFGTRNASTDIKSNGYGRSELEDMIQTVTALLNSDNYNANFFKVGSAPKGILKYSGDLNMNTVEQFKNQWIAQTAGVMNMHKIPIMNADKMDFVNLQQSNKDMEYSKYQEFLIKISCALYKMDPSEIGFPMSGSSDAKPMFEGNNEARLKHSRDKGLKPLLKQVERWINKYIIWQLDKDYEFRFVGIDDETSFSEELENNIKMINNFKTLNEIRSEYNLDPIKGGEIVLNPMYFQNIMAQQQQGGDEGGQDNAFDSMFGEDFDQQQKDEKNPFQQDENESTNPFTKGLKEDIIKMLSTELN
jgi:hypothetical protein